MYVLWREIFTRNVVAFLQDKFVFWLNGRSVYFYEVLELDLASVTGHLAPVLVPPPPQKTCVFNYLRVGFQVSYFQQHKALKYDFIVCAHRRLR